MVPKLRFKEFCGEWDEKSIEFLGTVVTGNTPSTNDSTNYGDEYMFVSPGDLGESKYINKTEKMLSKKGFNSCRKLEKGAILVTCIGSTIGKIGIANHRMTTNQQINSIIVNDVYNNEFIYYSLIFNFPKYMNFIGKQAVPILNKSQFEKLKLKCPSFSEQTKIADFLSTVDDKIQNQQDKITHLENIKKGFMQKIFSRKVRFKDDGGKGFSEWEEEKLGDISYSISSGKSSKDLQGKYNLYGSTGIIGKTNNIECQGEFILVARVGANAGKVNCINGIYGVSDNTIIIRNKEEIISKFLYYRLEFYNINRLVFGSGQPLVTSTDLKKIKIKIPSKKEQQKITDFLSLFDEKISIEKEMLEDLKHLKKGLLQQMFV